MSDIESVPGRPRAGMFKRLVSHAIDSLIVAMVLGVGSAAIHFSLQSEQFKFILLSTFLTGATLLVITVVFVLGIARKGQTPGKKVMQLVIVDARAEKHIGIGRAILRQFVLGLLGPLNIFQLIVIPLSKRHQGLHDMAADSVVLEGKPIIPKRPKALMPLPAEGRVFAAPVPPSSPTAPLSLATSASPPVAPSSSQRGPAVRPPTVSGSMASPLSASPPAATSPPYGVPDAPRRNDAVPRPAWTLRTVAGTECRIEQHVLVGRDPDLGQVPGALSWRIDDTTLTVSKTHALFGVDAGAVWVEDWSSTNGVRLVRGGADRELRPRERMPLQPGDVIVLGDFRLQLRGDR